MLKGVKAVALLITPSDTVYTVSVLFISISTMLNKPTWDYLPSFAQHKSAVHATTHFVDIRKSRLGYMIVCLSMHQHQGMHVHINVHICLEEHAYILTGVHVHVTHYSGRL